MKLLTSLGAGLLLWLASAASAQSPAPPLPTPAGLRTFTCGNSFHAWYIAPILEDIAKKAGITGHQIVGVSKIGGSQAIDHWNVPDDKNEAKAALTHDKVDALTLACMLHPDEGIADFAELGLSGNPDFHLYLQEFWIPWDKFEWPYTGREEDVNPDAATPEFLQALHAPYFAEMDAYVRQLNEKLGKQVVFVAPTGQAVINLRNRIIAGQVPGIARQSELFTDKLGHPQPPIQALAGYIYFSVLYHRSPVGLPLLEILATAPNPAWRTDELNHLLQQIAWDEVAKHPLSGVTPP